MEKQEQIKILLEDMISILTKRLGDISDYTFRFVHERTLHIENQYHVCVIHLHELDKHRMFEHLTEQAQDRIELLEQVLPAGDGFIIRKTTKPISKELTSSTEPTAMDRLIEQTFEIEI